MAIALLVITSCAGGNTPSGVAKQTMQAMKDKNYDKLAELIYIKDAKSETAKEAREEIKALLKEKLSKMPDTDAQIKSFKVIDEEIDESGEKAVVTMRVEYDNGDVDEDSKIKLRLDDNKQWKVDFGK